MTGEPRCSVPGCAGPPAAVILQASRPPGASVFESALTQPGAWVRKAFPVCAAHAAPGAVGGEVELLEPPA